MKGRSIAYGAAEMAWLEENRTMPIAELYRGFSDRFGRTDVSAANLHALRKRKGWRTGRTGRFEPGQEPVNKGQACEPGRGGRHPNPCKTQFRAGERRGVALRLYKPVGTERLSKEGYLERKIHDGFPLQSRWRAVHIVRWEDSHGLVQPGHALKCLDGNRLNTDPANWEAISRGVLVRLNGGRFKQRLAFDGAAPGIKPAVMALAKLEHETSAARKRKGRSG